MDDQTGARDPAPGVRARTLRSWVDPDAVFAALGRDGFASVWRDPWTGGGRGNGFIGLAANPEDALILDDPSAGVDAFAARLRERLLAADARSDLLGWWGCIAYELGAAGEGPPPEGLGPRALFAFVDRGIVFDRVTRTVTLIVLADASDAGDWLDSTEQRLVVLPAAAAGAGPVAAPRWRWRWRHDRAAYLEKIARCQAAIRRGDAYQLCLTNAITVEHAAEETLDPLEVYLRLRTLTPTEHCGVLRVDDRWLLSASPEQFLAVDRSGTARTRPMKGTRPRSADAVADRALAAELLASEKERAENLMIVDLMRNDLSRVSLVGSVTVPELFAVESYGWSHQLVSTVQSALETDAVAAVLALFPAGSMTGAPKRAAMRILAELEEGPRGVYSGVWGRLSLDGSVDLAVVIRSIAIGPDGVRIGSGGGITALSDPVQEWDEVVLKARPMLLAIGADPDP